jgi:hypothetical protein
MQGITRNCIYCKIKILKGTVCEACQAGFLEEIVSPTGKMKSAPNSKPYRFDPFNSRLGPRATPSFNLSPLKLDPGLDLEQAFSQCSVQEGPPINLSQYRESYLGDSPYNKSAAAVPPPILRLSTQRQLDLQGAQNSEEALPPPSLREAVTKF